MVTLLPLKKMKKYSFSGFMMQIDHKFDFFHENI